jgi:hypothetical protein
MRQKHFLSIISFDSRSTYECDTVEVIDVSKDGTASLFRDEAVSPDLFAAHFLSLAYVRGLLFDPVRTSNSASFESIHQRLSFK